MKSENYHLGRECTQVQTLLTDYAESTLSAREVWAVEKHLATCPDCAQVSREIQVTIRLLHTMEHRDTEDDFMARLHARLDSLEPEAARPHSLRATAEDWLAGLGMSLRKYRVPALSLGLTTTATLAVLIFWRASAPVVPVRTPPITPMSQEPLLRNVALTASNPFEDPVAAMLEARSALHETKNNTRDEADSL